jgi:hypothetical protein
MLPLAASSEFNRSISFLRQSVKDEHADSVLYQENFCRLNGGLLHHHLTEVLPIIGLSPCGLSGPLSLILIIGILANVVGISIMLEKIQGGSLPDTADGA